MNKENKVSNGIIVNNLFKSYKNRVVLRGVSLNVKSGEVVGILGPNGAGKTTCFYCITGLIQPDRGKILLNDKNISYLPFYRRARLGIGYLPQESSIFRGLSVENNIMAVLEVVEKNKDKRMHRLEELLKEFSIEHLRKSPSVALSGGERRRLEIARLLAANPKFVLFDEPFAGVDPIAVNDIRDLVSHLKDKGLGVLITDHNVRETLDIVDRSYVLHDGVILTEGDKKHIISHEGVRKYYLGDSFNY